MNKKLNSGENKLLPKIKKQLGENTKLKEIYDNVTAMAKGHAPNKDVPYPGSFIKEEIFEKHGLEISEIAERVDLDPIFLEYVLKDYCFVTTEVAYKLGKEFEKYGYNSMTLLFLQNAYELDAYMKRPTKYIYPQVPEKTLARKHHSFFDEFDPSRP